MSLPLADAVRGMIHVLGDAEWEADARKIADNIAKLERENAALRKELEAQAVVNGKGSEREAKLLAEVAALRKQLEQWNQSTEWFGEWAEKKQELERENAALRAAIKESEEFARKNGETAGLKIEELLRENAALREQVRCLKQDLFITRQRRCHEIVESEKEDV